MRPHQKTLMVLGAGPNQLPLIRAAVAAGHTVATVDNVPDNVGHRFSQHFVDCSTVDPPGVLEAARGLTIDGITTCASDVATPTVGYVAEELGLPGPGSQAASRMSNKALFREFQQSEGFAGPSFCFGTAFDEIEGSARALSLPLIFKPVDASGSRGVVRIDHFERETLLSAFAEAKRCSRSGQVCVEEYVDGHDVSGDGFLIGGGLRAIVTRKHTIDLVPRGHQLPTHLSAAQQRGVKREVEAICRSIGYYDGPIDFDVRVSAAGATVLEMSPRLGGNAIPALIRHATGVDLVGATIEHALGGLPHLPEGFTVVRPCASLVLGSPIAGIVRSVTSASELQATVPELLECAVEVVEGDEVGAFVHSANGIGYALFECPRPDDFEIVGERIHRALALTVAPVETTLGSAAEAEAR